jgi:hypothetical protein
MSDLKELLQRVVPALQRANVPFMIAGSFASAAHGLPRATQDLDIVIDPTAEGLDALLAQLPPDSYYADADVAREALRTRGMFNVIDHATGWKIDFILRRNRAFSREEFGRRISVSLLDVDSSSRASPSGVRFCSQRCCRVRRSSSGRWRLGFQAEHALLAPDFLGRSQCYSVHETRLEPPRLAATLPRDLLGLGSQESGGPLNSRQRAGVEPRRHCSKRDLNPTGLPPPEPKSGKRVASGRE